MQYKGISIHGNWCQYTPNFFFQNNLFIDHPFPWRVLQHAFGHH
jgi:hypothetical protein